MWANSIWGLIGLGAAFVLARISMIWTPGHDEWGPRFELAAVMCFAISIAVLILPLVRRPPRIAAFGIIVSFLCLVGFTTWYYLAIHGEPSEVKVVPDGFIQFESREVLVSDASQLAAIDNFYVGQVLKIKFTFANRGTRKVFDNQSWGLFAFVDPGKNPGKNLRPIIMSAVKDGYKRFAGSGNEVGVGITGYNVAVSQPLTAKDVADLKGGLIRVHLLIGGAWKDDLGREFNWAECQWTNWPEVSLAQSFWKTC
jgi:hypothetical protein